MAARAILAIVCAVVSLLAKSLVQHRPWLVDVAAPEKESSFKIYRDSKLLDGHLEKYKEQFGNDYEGYRNHCLRVLSFAVQHLKDTGYSQQKVEKAIPVMELAVAYHDIGLWTDAKLDYLERSAARMEMDTTNVSAHEREVAKQAILQHHKLTTWAGSDADIVNAIRKADWTDASLGIFTGGLYIGNVGTTLAALPNSGFHRALAGMGARLSPDSLLGQLRVLNVFQF